MFGTGVRPEESPQTRQAAIPPLFAEPLRGDLLARIEQALTNGEDETSAALLREGESAFPADSVFVPLHLRHLKLKHRREQCTTSLEEAAADLADLRFVAGLGRFREGIALARGAAPLEGKVFQAAVEETHKLAATTGRLRKLYC